MKFFSAWSKALIWTRDALDPLATFGTILVWVFASVWLCQLIADPPEDAAWWLAPVAMALAAGLVAAARFTWATLLVAGAVVVLLAGTALTRIGIAHTESDTIDGFRRAATTSMSQVAELAQRPSPAVTLEDASNAVDAAQEALGALERLTDADPDVLTSARDIASDLEKARSGAEDQGQLLEALGPKLDDLLARVETDAAELNVVTLQRAANTALATALGVEAVDRASNSIEDARRLAGELCVQAGGTVRPSGDAPDQGTRCVASDTDPAPEADAVPEGESSELVANDDISIRQLAVSRATTDLAVAQAALALAADDDRQAANEAVSRAFAVLADVTSRVDEAPEEIALGAALTAGAGAVASDALGAVDVPLKMEVLGWSIVAAALAWYLRRLSITNAGRALGPVAISAPTDDDADAQRFRTALLLNVPEPGAVPGSNALVELTNLVGTVEPLVQGKSLSAALKALSEVIVVPRGYAVEYADVQTASEATDTEPATKAAVVVRVREARTSTLIGQHVARNTDRTVAVRSAAYWAAATIIDASAVVPPWARWDPASSEALALYHRQSDLGDEPTLDMLRIAVRNAPSSGVLGLRLAQQEALAKDLPTSFATAARVVITNPRYQNARYRLAIGASLLSTVPATITTLPSVVRRQLADDLDSMRAKDLADLVRNGTTDYSFEAHLRTFADHQLKSARRKLALNHVLWQSLRSEGRAEQLSLLWFRRRRRDMKHTGKSCRYTVQARAATTGGELDKLRTKAERFAARNSHRTIWQANYNLACFWSIAGEATDVDQAFSLLERARRSRGSQQLTAAWLTTDPDLVTIQSDPRFEDFLALLAEQEPAT